ncbi:MAG: DUF4333 domain-containing protein [Actinomycetes bacterium]
MTTDSLPEPGWYPDPAGGQQLRWWNGTNWSNSTHLPLTAPAPSPLAAPGPLPPQPPTPAAPSAPPGGHHSAVPAFATSEAPPQANRFRVWFTLLFVVLLITAIVVAAMALIYTRNRSLLDVRGIEQQVSAVLSSEGQTSISVRCPESVPVAADNTFECTATDPAGTQSTVIVHQDDDHGNVTWHLGN